MADRNSYREKLGLAVPASDVAVHIETPDGTLVADLTPEEARWVASDLLALADFADLPFETREEHRAEESDRG